MKWFVWMLAAACAWTLHSRYAELEPQEPLPAVSSSAVETPVSGLARLRGDAGGEAPQPADPVVLCRMGEEAEYLRASDCAKRGGQPGLEPIWARVD